MADSAMFLRAVARFRALQAVEAGPGDHVIYYCRICNGLVTVEVSAKDRQRLGPDGSFIGYFYRVCLWCWPDRGRAARDRFDDAWTWDPECGLTSIRVLAALDGSDISMVLTGSGMKPAGVAGSAVSAGPAGQTGSGTGSGKGSGAGSD